MKNNIKALKLVESGLSSKTVFKLTESQINILYSKLISEQPQPIKTNKTVQQITLPSGAQTTVGGISVSNIGGKTQITQTTEGELEEDDDMDLDFDQMYTGQEGPHDEDESSDDGMDDDTSPKNHDSKMIGMSEGKKKKKKFEPNPWAICHAQVGPKKTRKFERCVMAVKKSLKEGKNPVSLFLENEIMRIVEKHIPPRITKRDLVSYLMETETAPAKPKTDPTTKPGKPAPRPRPGHPGKNPNPGENPAPKAVSPEKAKEEVINTIMKLLEK